MSTTAHAPRPWRLVTHEESHNYPHIVDATGALVAEAEGNIRDWQNFTGPMIVTAVNKGLDDKTTPDTAPSTEPPPGMLMSMALRYDHGFGCPGYYDMPMFGAGNRTHAQRLESTLRDMHKLWEEASGNGFYSLDRADYYVAMEQAGLRPASAALTAEDTLDIQAANACLRYNNARQASTKAALELESAQKAYNELCDRQVAESATPHTGSST